MRLRRATIAAISAAVFSATGCSNDEREAVANAPTETFDPCSIPADAIAATGLVRAADGAGWGEYDGADWSRCVWEYRSGEERYSMSALVSQSHTASQMAANPEYTEPKDVEIDGRSATRFRIGSGVPERRCGLIFGTAGGVVVLRLSNEGATWAVENNACELLVRHATDLSSHFPPAQ